MASIIFAAVAGAVTGAVGLVGTATAGLSAIGFGSAGVTAGSFAAAIHSLIGYVSAGSFFALFQSVGAAGLALTTKIVLGAAGAVGGAAAALLFL